MLLTPFMMHHRTITVQSFQTEAHARTKHIRVDLHLDIEAHDIRLIAAFTRRALRGKLGRFADIRNRARDFRLIIAANQRDFLTDMVLRELRLRHLDVNPVVLRVLHGDERRAV